IKFEDDILGLLLLNSLPESWENFKVTITNSSPNDVVSLQVIKGGEVRKGKEKRVKVNSSPYTRMWSVTTITKQGIYRSIVSCGKRRTKAKRSVNFVSDESMWIIDSGATLHVTPRKEFFTSYTIGDFGVLKMGNDGVTKVIGVGDVCLQTNTGMQLWLRGVKHAP
ncbi:hypothetical protein CR513_19584, partial [Mucuna pruriens]